jgi:hypothetical protein
MITLIYAVAMIQIQPFVLLYTGGVSDVNYNRPLIGYILTLNGFLHSIKTPQGMLVISAGLYRETRWRTMTQALIAIVLSVVLGWKCGVVGIMTGMCISNIYRDIDLVLFAPRYVTHTKVRDTVNNLAVAILEFGIIVALGIMIKFDNSSLLLWFLASAANMAIGVTVILGVSFILRPGQLRNSFLRVANVFHKTV